MGVLNAREIASSDERVEAMALGAEDFTASMGAVRSPEGMEVFFARNAVLLACREAGIEALDYGVFQNRRSGRAAKGGDLFQKSGI